MGTPVDRGSSDAMLALDKFQYYKGRNDSNRYVVLRETVSKNQSRDREGTLEVHSYKYETQAKIVAGWHKLFGSSTKVFEGEDALNRLAQKAYKSISEREPLLLIGTNQSTTELRTLREAVSSLRELVPDRFTDRKDLEKMIQELDAKIDLDKEWTTVRTKYVNLLEKESTPPGELLEGATAVLKFVKKHENKMTAGQADKFRQMADESVVSAIERLNKQAEEGTPKQQVVKGVEMHAYVKNAKEFLAQKTFDKLQVDAVALVQSNVDQMHAQLVEARKEVAGPNLKRDLFRKALVDYDAVKVADGIADLSKLEGQMRSLQKEVLNNATKTLTSVQAKLTTDLGTVQAKEIADEQRMSETEKLALEYATTSGALFDSLKKVVSDSTIAGEPSVKGIKGSLDAVKGLLQSPLGHETAVAPKDKREAEKADQSAEKRDLNKHELLSKVALLHKEASGHLREVAHPSVRVLEVMQLRSNPEENFKTLQAKAAMVPGFNKILTGSERGSWRHAIAEVLGKFKNPEDEDYQAFMKMVNNPSSKLVDIIDGLERFWRDANVSNKDIQKYGNAIMQRVIDNAPREIRLFLEGMRKSTSEQLQKEVEDEALISQMQLRSLVEKTRAMARPVNEQEQTVLKGQVAEYQRLNMTYEAAQKGDTALLFDEIVKDPILAARGFKRKAQETEEQFLSRLSGEIGKSITVDNLVKGEVERVTKDLKAAQKMSDKILGKEPVIPQLEETKARWKEMYDINLKKLRVKVAVARERVHEKSNQAWKELHKTLGGLQQAFQQATVLPEKRTQSESLVTEVTNLRQQKVTLNKERETVEAHQTTVEAWKKEKGEQMFTVEEADTLNRMLDQHKV
ncbi:MAG: hypothetical protein H0X51_02010 [Parachlamydiaceae bacterium]|nr:hypothetical protein [Parachlamydiaceae bacterium]